MTQPSGPANTPNMNAGRGVVLLLIAVVLGIGILQATDKSDEADNVATATTEKAAEKTKSTTTSTTSTTLATRSPEEITAIVLNGSGTSGVAGRYTDQMEGIGYKMEAADDAPSNVAVSAIFYRPGFQAEARELAETLKIKSSEVKPMPNPSPAPTSKASLIVVVGADLAK